MLKTQTAGHFIQTRLKSSGVEETGANGSDFLQNGLISKCQVMSGKNVSGFSEEAKTVKFVVQEMFVGSDDVLVRSDHNLGSEKNDIESDSLSFRFDLLNSTNQDSQEQISEVENIDQEREEDHRFKIDQEGIEEEEEDDQFKIDQERIEDDNHSYIDQERTEDQEMEDGDHYKPLCSEESLEDRHNLNLSFSEDETPEEQDEVEFLPIINSSSVADQESDSVNWMRDFLDLEGRDDLPEECGYDHNSLVKDEDLDDEYIELENLSFEFTHTDNETTSYDDCNEVEVSQEQKLMQTEASTTFQQQQQTSCWDTESDEDEPDVLSQHQSLVQQMKMELKACRVKGLPTISEECESPKMLDDLKPLDIGHKIEYKDIMEEIHKFYKIFSRKMRKLDVLSYQTLQAISFLHLKDSQVFTAGKKKVDLLPSVLPKIWQRKVQRIYADPMHKPVSDMHRDMELVYVGRLCLSWEILSWLYIKSRELLDYDCEGNHSYNQAAEEFQQFQVLMQRFMEDEPFQQLRNRCYVRNVFQVPIIRDDCLKIKKERGEESDAVSLEMLVEIIRESMLIFRKFLFADKKSRSIATKIDLQDIGNSELLSNIILDVQKKERRMKDSIRSRNCIVKKLKQRQGWRLDWQMLTCEVELRLIVRVVNMSRLTGEQLVWCSKKLDNISFVGRKVHIEPSFLLFPC